MVTDLRARPTDRRITLEVTTQPRTFVAREGFDPGIGARRLRRFLARQVETHFGRALVTGVVYDGGAVFDGAVGRVELVDGELSVSFTHPRSGRQKAV